MATLYMKLHSMWQHLLRAYNTWRPPKSLMAGLTSTFRMLHVPPFSNSHSNTSCESSNSAANPNGVRQTLVRECVTV